MKLTNALAVFCIIFLLLFAGYFATFGWGSLAQKENLLALELVKFDKKIAQGKDACFELAVKSTLGRQFFADYTISTGNLATKSEQIDVGKSQTINECVSANFLQNGENSIKIEIRNQTVFFHTEVLDSISQKAAQLEVKPARESIEIKVSGNQGNEFEPIEIFVNGKIGHKIYFSGENFSSTEKLSLESGQNNVEVKFQGITKTATIQKQQQFQMNPLAGFAIIAIQLAVFFSLVFFNKPVLERIALSILSFFTVTIVLFLALDTTGINSAEIFVVAFAALTLLLAVLSAKNLKKAGDLPKKISLKEFLYGLSPLAIALIFVLFFAAMLYHFMTPTYYSIFTSFYERQSQLIAQQGNVPAIDPFSFLGTKPFGYVSGYFFLNAALSWLSGLSTKQSFEAIALLSQAALICTAIIFMRSINIKEKNSYLGAILLLMGTFVFSDYLFNIRHVVAESFLFASLYFLKKNKLAASGALIALGGFIQPPVFLMFAAICLIIVDWKREAKNFAKATLIGTVLLALLFLPTIIKTGIPTQAKPAIWGYFWSIPVYGFLLDFLSIFVFIAIFIVPLLYFRKARLDGFAKKALLVLLLFVFVQLFVSYRINVVNSIVLAILIAHVFPPQFLSVRYTEYALAVLFGIMFFIMGVVSVSFYPLHPFGTDAFLYANQNTSQGANFLVEPYLGHPFILVAQRKASADLAVEYADENMINDSYRYLKEKDNSILQKYSIDFIVNRSIFLDEKPVGDNMYTQVIEFPDQDKIYSNEIFFIHSVRKK